MTDDNIQSLIAIMARLRDPSGGCPWDLEQDFASIAPYTIEEAYEVADAIEREDYADLQDELGDLLLQVIFHSQMATEAGHFGFDDVVASICDKMIRRHPHVFADTSLHSDTAAAAPAAAVVTNWEAIKQAERSEKISGSGALAGVAVALPALLRAQKIQKRAARVGFDWPDTSGASAKLHEEIAELQNAASDDDRFEEMGDLLFAAVNVARHHGIDAEAALKAGTRKFERRFCAMEADAGPDFAEMTLEEKEAAWQRVKQAETGHENIA